MTEKYHCKRFKPSEIARYFPATAETLLMDTYLTQRTGCELSSLSGLPGVTSALSCGLREYLYVLSGRGTFWMGDASNGGEFAPGDLLFFKSRTVHALPKILDGPVVFLSFDTPRRDPKDIIFVNPEDGTPETFVRGKEL